MVASPKGGLAWKVKLREGVTWHDGAPFTAEDVKYTLELINASGFKARTRVGQRADEMRELARF